MIVINKRRSILVLFLIFIKPFVFANTIYQIKCVPDSVMHNDILGCYIDQYQIVDKQLNEVYKNKINKLSEKDKIELRNLQLKWIKEKELSCIVDEANYGRESHFDAMQCEIDMTEQRIKFLKGYK